MTKIKILSRKGTMELKNIILLNFIFSLVILINSKPSTDQNATCDTRCAAFTGPVGWDHDRCVNSCLQVFHLKN